MLKITIVGPEMFNEETSEIFHEWSLDVELEHSLVSLSKWESRYEKPFLGKEEKTPEEIMGYVEAMVVTPNFDPTMLFLLTEENLHEVNEYINKKQTATWFNELPNAQKQTEVITSELIYYWMNTLGIDKEYETWHLNRLFTLIKIHSTKQNTKKMSPKDAAAQRAAINAKRRQQLGTTG